MTHPNLIFIVFDTLRADRVLCEYKNKNLSPYINKLLDNSIYFENCIANSPWTLPSHISMFTGLYPTQIRIISGEVDKLSNKVPVLAEILKDMGYYTICFSENVFITKMYGLTRGFDKELQVWDMNPWNQENYKLFQLMKFLKKIDLFIQKRIKLKLILNFWTHIQKRSENLIKEIIKRFLLNDILFKLKNKTIDDFEKLSQILQREKKYKPFFIFFNLLTAHEPYIPFQKFFKSFNITIKDFKKIKNLIIEPLKYRLKINIKSKRLSNQKVRVIKKLYDAGVISSDFVMNKLFTILKKLGLIENSYIIITSDHGEHLGDHLDHYLWEHGTYISLYEGVIKVPLLIYNKNFKKKIAKNQVQLKDLFHTILNLTGIPVPQNKYLDINKSIIHQIEHKSTPKYIFGEYLNPKETMIDLINSHRRTINRSLIPKIFSDVFFLRSDSYKYIKFKNNKFKEFYNLTTDPHEQINLVGEDNDILNEMKSKMKFVLEIINNPEELKDLITKREKDLIKKKISRFDL